MNKIMIAVAAVLLAAVVFLFVKVSAMERPGQTEDADRSSSDSSQAKTKTDPEQTVQQQATQPTGRIAYVNIDELNEQSLEIIDLVAESKRRQSGIEASVDGLRARYQQKVEEFQRSQQAGIAPESELRAKAKEIEDIEQEAANKQMLMENLTLDISEKNANFQRTVREFLQKWNSGRYDFILSYSESVPTMLLGNSSLEVTEEVIRELNEEYKQKRNARKKK